MRAVVPKPWKSLKLLYERDTALLLSVSAVFYMVYYIIQTSIPQILQRIYHLREAEIGLCYFAVGCGLAIGGFINGTSISLAIGFLSDNIAGKLMDFNYRTTAQNAGFKIDKVAGDDLRHFPIEQARTRFVLVYIILHTLCLIAYGWTLHRKVVRTKPTQPTKPPQTPQHDEPTNTPSSISQSH